jgi:hypothetical protein
MRVAVQRGSPTGLPLLLMIISAILPLAMEFSFSSGVDGAPDRAFRLSVWSFMGLARRQPARHDLSVAAYGTFTSSHPIWTLRSRLIGFCP